MKVSQPLGFRPTANDLALIEALRNDVSREIGMVSVSQLLRMSLRSHAARRGVAFDYGRT